MASNRKVFERASQHWRELHEYGQYSRDHENGYVAIVSSDWEFIDKRNEEAEGVQRDSFRQDAQNMSRYLQYEYNFSTHVVEGINRQKMIEILADRAVSSIITIGNGSLTALYIADDQGGDIDWRFIASHTDHLKRGFFQQRHCGTFDEDLSVPLGTFALAEHSDVFGYPNGWLPTNIDVTDKRIRRLHNLSVLEYEDVKERFPKEEWKRTSLPASASASAAATTG